MTPSELRTLLLIKDYLDSRGRSCFTYRGLRAHYARRGFYRDLEWHTVERAIRELARREILLRVEKSRKKVIFCWTDKAEQIYRKALEQMGYVS